MEHYYLVTYQITTKATGMSGPQVTIRGFAIDRDPVAFVLDKMADTGNNYDILYTRDITEAQYQAMIEAGYND